MLNKVKSRFLSGKITITFFLFAVYLLLSPVSQAQWVQTNGPEQYVSSIAINGSNIFAGTSFNYGVYLSTNNGQNWTQTSLNNGTIFSLAVSGSNVFAGSWNGGGNVYRSTDNGLNWTKTLLSYEEAVFSLAISGSNVFAGTDGVYRSTDNGQNWTVALANSRWCRSLATSGSNVFAGIENIGVYRSTNNGQNWTPSGLIGLTVLSLAVSGSNVFAGCYGVYRSTNNGENWTQTLSNQGGVYSLAISGSNIFAGTYNNGVYLSTNNGQNWTEWNEGGMGNVRVLGLAVSSEYIFAGTGGYSVWRRPLIQVGLTSIGSSFSEKYNLYQNYPNPFNPVTKLKFDIPNNSFVKLIVFDVIGREVITLVNEQLNPGSYEVDWNASDYPSGIYFYKLTSENYSETKRMVLIK